jgi:glycosyltransferase involved in cell wall biosynthesis
MRDELAAKLAILQADEFDAHFYLDQCISARLTGIFESASLLDHYIQRGWRLSLDPSPQFSVSGFLRENPVVAAEDAEPLSYVLRHGWPAEQAAPNQLTPEGSVDYLSLSRAIGWTWLPDLPAAAMTIVISQSGTVITEALACALRPDLAESGKGTGLYGFDLSFSGAQTREQPLVEAVWQDQRWSLSVGNFDLPPEAEGDIVIPAVEAGSTSLRIEGGIDRVTPFDASGWVWAPAQPEALLQVEVHLDGSILGRGVADQMREDLLSYGKGTGLYGFKIRFSQRLPAGSRPVFVALVAAENTIDYTQEIAAGDAVGLPDASRTTLDTLVTEHEWFTSRGPLFEEHDPTILDGVSRQDRPLLMAFYLPQMHPIPENDTFWGTGFTEWRQLPRALSRFPGHYQPRIPRDLGFYNLLDRDHLRRQVEMAMASGIDAFAFYYYWFNGRRVLEKPLDLFVKSKFEQNFVLIWANENWTRTWDGSESHVLLRQDYRLEDEAALLENLASYFSQDNYVRIQGRPLFFIYNPGNIPETRKTIIRYRATLSVRYGIDPLFFMCQTFGQENPSDLGFDGAMEFPPHKLGAFVHARPTLDAYSSNYTGTVVSYDEFAAASLNLPPTDYPLIKTAVPGWDNDPRRPNRGYTLEKIAPAKFEAWVSELIERATDAPIFGRAIVAINAWNEWAEGAYLEPDVHYGSAFLNAAARALRQACETLNAPPAAVEGAAFPKVSVIVPNYNHAKYLEERLGSLLNQTVLPDEIIFLDDCSRDDSLAVANRILEAGSVPWRIVPNEVNSGGVFRQWMKGLSLARNTLIWIAESDDSADPRFLERLLPAFERSDVMIALGRIHCMGTDGTPRSDLDGYLSEMQNFAWHKSVVVPAYTAFQRDFTLRNVIANASGAVFRKPHLTEAEIARIYEYRFAGDWLFYALVLRGGSIALQHRAKSLFRIGQTSASRDAFGTEQHRREHAMVLQDIVALYDPPQDTLRQHINLLSTHFPDEALDHLVARTLPQRPPASERMLRICIAAHSFDVGGGELVPLELANALKAKGHHVTYLVVESPQGDGGGALRSRLRPDIPVIYWDSIRSDVQGALAKYGVQVVNSHNISLETRLCHAAQRVRVPYVASLHGGYEHAAEYVTPQLISFVDETVSHWFYLSDKNYTMLLKAGIPKARFQRSFNALGPSPDPDQTRAEIRAGLKLRDSTLAMVVCSRAIYAKGWQTAIDATKLRHEAGADVHLVLIGGGPDLAALQEANEHLPYVTFLGQIDRPQRLLAGFDLGVFPSVYVGESFPMFLLECFQAGLPVITTAVGEIGFIMGNEPARQPGVLIKEKRQPSGLVRKFAESIAMLQSDDDAFQRARENTRHASDRFSMDRLIMLYEDAFRKLTMQGVKTLDLADADAGASH